MVSSSTRRGSPDKTGRHIQYNYLYLFGRKANSFLFCNSASLAVISDGRSTRRYCHNRTRVVPTRAVHANCLVDMGESATLPIQSRGLPECGPGRWHELVQNRVTIHFLSSPLVSVECMVSTWPMSTCSGTARHSRRGWNGLAPVRDSVSTTICVAVDRLLQPNPLLGIGARRPGMTHDPGARCSAYHLFLLAECVNSLGGGWSVPWISKSARSRVTGGAVTIVGFLGHASSVDLKTYTATRRRSCGKIVPGSSLLSIVKEFNMVNMS